MKKGDLIRNKSDGKYAIVISTYIKFFQEFNYGGDADYGSAGTAIVVEWIESGYKHTLRKSKMRHNWEVVSCK